MLNELKKKLLVMGITGMLMVVIAHMLLLFTHAPNPNPKMVIVGYIFTALVTFIGLILRMNSITSNTPTQKNKQEEK